MPLINSSKEHRINPDESGFFIMRSIILLHGAIGASDQLVPLAKELDSKGHKTYLMDFSGHGIRDFTSGFGIVAFANELKEFISANNLAKPHIFGYSMGGYVALYAASLHPGLTGNIVTLGTKFDWSPETVAKEIKMLDPKTISEKVPKFAVALQKRHSEKWKLLLKKTAEMMLDLGDDNLLNENSFSKIQCKVAIGLADNDNMVSVSETDFAAGNIKDSVRFLLKDTKHPIETANIRQLSEIIDNFVSK